ncbi:MAG: EAL domain-containing protein [Lachnospiraceae bacterium]|nr:EAL domain-containing protein [Lachnospiraceae bacterium]
MIYYDHLPLDKDILKALGELSINYVFQPIYEPDGKTIYAREALMRPTEMNVMELIDEYTKLEKLHVIEVATFFGAMQEYALRGYECNISMNSFPSEYFRKSEQEAFTEYFGDMSGLGIIEMLEYPYIDPVATLEKAEAIKRQNLQIAVDDFGTGLGNMDAVDLYQPHFVKLDRHLISGIDHTSEKQTNVRSLIDVFHKRNILVVAEGVETKEEFEYLVALGVDYLQGYYLAMPA